MDVRHNDGWRDRHVISAPTKTQNPRFSHQKPHHFVFPEQQHKLFPQSSRQELSIAYKMTMMQDDHEDNNMMQDHEESSEPEMGLSAAATTIDPSVVQSRIRQSASLQQEMQQDGEGDQPVFPKLNASQANGNKSEYRRVRCPPHRYTPLREHWEQILTPLVEYLKLQVRATKNYYYNIIHEMSATKNVHCGE
jgi:hypothetical protein